MSSKSIFSSSLFFAVITLIICVCCLTAHGESTYNIKPLAAKTDETICFNMTIFLNQSFPAEYYTAANNSFFGPSQFPIDVQQSYLFSWLANFGLVFDTSQSGAQYNYLSSVSLLLFFDTDNTTQYTLYRSFITTFNYVTPTSLLDRFTTSISYYPTYGIGFQDMAPIITQLYVPSTCRDGIKNGDETDIDCGGSCNILCQPGHSCQSDYDCVQYTDCQNSTSTSAVLDLTTSSRVIRSMVSNDLTSTIVNGECSDYDAATIQTRGRSVASHIGLSIAIIAIISTFVIAM